MRAKITKRIIDAAKPKARDWFIWDEDVSGFGLKITPSGRKIFVLQYRMGGREASTKRYSIGKVGSPWTPDTARDEALRLLRLVQDGADPMRIKAEERTEPTVAQFCDQYLADGPVIKPDKKASSWAIDRSNMSDISSRCSAGRRSAKSRPQT